jgi:hypothetical protein
LIPYNMHHKFLSKISLWKLWFKNDMIVLHML